MFTYLLFIRIVRVTYRALLQSSSMVEPNTSRSSFSRLSVVISAWNKLNPDICYSRSYIIFPEYLLKFIKPVEKKTYHMSDFVGIKILIELRLSFSHLYEHKIRYYLKDTLKHLCLCSTKAETTTHHFLY